MGRQKFNRQLVRDHQTIILEADLAEAQAAGRLGQEEFDRRKKELDGKHGGYPDPEQRLGFWLRELAILARSSTGSLHCSAS